MTEDDQEFGPVPRAELDSWYAEGLITAKCQVLRDGGTEWQFAHELYPSLIAKPTAPAAPTAPTKPTKPSKPTAPITSDLELLDAPGPAALQPLDGLQPLSAPAWSAPAPAAMLAPVNPYTAPTMQPAKWGGGSATRSAFAGWAGIMCMVAGGAYVARALLYFVLRAMTATAIIGGGFTHGGLSRATSASVIGIIMIVLALVIAIPYFIGGFGILARAFWGKITGTVCAGLSVVCGLFFLFVLFRSVINYFNLLRLPFPFPAEFHLQVVFGLFVDALLIAILVAQAVTAFMLYRSQHTHEFR
jgi:hypothetical protein